MTSRTFPASLTSQTFLTPPACLGALICLISPASLAVQSSLCAVACRPRRGLHGHAGVPRFAQGVLLSSQGVTLTVHPDFHHGGRLGLPGGPQICLVVHLAHLIVHLAHLTVTLDRQTVTPGRLKMALVSQNPAP